MAKFDCSDIKNTKQLLQAEDYFKKRAADHGFAEKYETGLEGKSWFARFKQSMFDKYMNADRPITAKEHEKMVKRFVKGKDEQTSAILTNNIEALLKNNTLLREHFWQLISFESVLPVPDEIMGKKPYETTQKKIIDPISLKEKTYTVPVLAQLPVPVLDKIYTELYNWAHAGSMRKIAPGFIGGMQLELFTPRQIELKDRSGAIKRARFATERYLDNAQHRSLEYWENDKKGNPGFNTYISVVSDLHSHGKTQTTVDMMNYIFQFFPGGRIKIDDETGEVFSYRDWVFTGEYWQDGNPKYKWDTLEPLMNNKRGYEGQQVILDPKPPYVGAKSALEIFLDAHKGSQALFKKFGEDQQGELTKMNSRYARMNEIINSGIIPSKYVEELTPHIHSDVNIGGFNSLELVKSGSYSPILFQSAVLPEMFDEVREQLIDRREVLLTAIQGGKLTPEERDANLKRLYDLDNSLIYVEESRDNFDEMTEDPHSGQKILTRQYVKNFKPITGMFDHTRRTIGRYVISDYLDEVGKAQERNAVTLDVLEALALADTDATREYVMNLYKTTFNYPDAKSTFMTMDIDLASIHGKFKNLGLNVNMDWARRWLKVLGSYQIFNLLHGPVVGLRNKTAQFNKIHDVGLERVVDAQEEIDGKDQVVWKQRAERAGVINFTRYMEGYVARALRPDERKAAKDHIKYLYHLIDEARENPRKSKLLLKRYQKRLKLAKFDYKLDSRLNALAQWAVTHNTSDVDLRAPTAEQKKQMKGLFSMYKSVASIQDTEGYVRTLSYIIGVKSAVAKGMATNYDDPVANEYGIEYTYLSDHGLSQQHLGYAFRGALGNQNTKLKYWSTQRGGRSWRITRDALRSLGDYSFDPDTGKKYNTSTFRKATRLLTSLVAAPGGRSKRAIREANPYVAAWRSFFLKQGLATFLIDFVIMAPGTSAVTGLMRRMFYGGGMVVKAGTGLQDDLLSVTFAVFQILWLAGMGELEEEDLDDRFWTKLARHSWLGVLPNSLISMIAALTRDYDRQTDQYKKDWDGRHGPNAITPFLPGGNNAMDAYNVIKSEGFKQIMRR